MSRVLREPLVHVVVLGVALFALHRWVAPPRASEEIVVSADALAGMRDDFRRRTGRMPSATDEQGMIDQLVDDEVLVREALEMGIERTDSVVRRRLIERMTVLLEESELVVPPPADGQLEAYLRAHADRYATPARVTFTHVFVSTQRAGERAPEVAAELKAQLDGGADPAGLGDPFLRGSEFRLHAQAELAAIFGPAFAAEVMAAPEGVWTGPVRSTYGAHVLRVSAKQAGTEPALTAVRERVQRDWWLERRRELYREARAKRRARYGVRVQEAGR